ncbi:hypothetical protein LPJ66_007354 [Kickxella alabastrina]|uniref:Uncharacterized protein n=1 Tax=Kickxella alabastrina TaxID=61397 RepID=A0ACC1I9S7_9FUNG|nr:hypothetical protein LPJ66_007354 [Kickxella alabastrina]
MFGLITRSLCVSVGYLYPAYKCFKLLRGGPEAIGPASGVGEQRDVVKGIIKYWIVMAAFTAVELVADTFMFWFPLKGMVKMSFVAWMVMPGINGAEIIYDRVLEPYLVSHEQQLDVYFQQARAAAQKSTSSVSKSAYDKWVGYVQRTINNQNAHAESSSLQSPASNWASNTRSEDQSSAGYSGLTGLLKTVSQSMPQQASAAAGYLAGLSGVAEAPPTQADAVGRSTLTSVITSWVTAFSSHSLTEVPDDQRLRDIRSRKLQLQDMVSQLESSEQVIVAKSAPIVEVPETTKQPEATTEVVADAPKDPSKFEDDAVMVNDESRAENAIGSHAEEPEKADVENNTAAADKKPATMFRRWFW